RVIPSVRFAQVEAAKLIVQDPGVADVDLGGGSLNFLRDVESRSLRGRVQRHGGFFFQSTRPKGDVVKTNVEGRGRETGRGRRQRHLDRLDALKAGCGQVDVESQVVMFGDDGRGEALGARGGTGDKAQNPRQSSAG